jgi:hypothetical protein
MLCDTAARLGGQPQQRVTSHGKEQVGARPLVTMMLPGQFAAFKGPSLDEANTSAPRKGKSNSGPVISTVVHRVFTLVYMKPAAGSSERVFVGQLLEPVVQTTKTVETVVGRGNQQRKVQTTETAHTVPKPAVHYFVPTNEDNEEGSTCYVRDHTVSNRVAVEAIHGRVEGYCNEIRGQNGLLTYFQVSESEMNRMESAVNHDSDQAHAPEEEIDAAESMLERQHEEDARRLAVEEGWVEGLDPPGRSRAPPLDFLEMSRYEALENIYRPR